MKILITGATGFVGSYLLGELNETHNTLVPSNRQERVMQLQEIHQSRKPQHATSWPIRPLCLPDQEGASKLIRETRPDVIVHLAAVSAVPLCEQDPDLAMAVNVEGTQNLLAAIVESQLPCRFIFISSSVIYGRVPLSQQPITEETAGQPINNYGRSKLAAEACVHDASSGLIKPPIIFRPFNHFGPGQDSSFVLSSFARQVAEIEAGIRPPIIKVGNLEVRRDFLDVRDVVRAYRLAIDNPHFSGCYNLASPQPFLLRDLLEKLQSFARCQFNIQIDQERVRSNDLKILTGCFQSWQKISGWSPKISIEKSLLDTLNYWREQVEKL